MAPPSRKQPAIHKPPGHPATAMPAGSRPRASVGHGSGNPASNLGGQGPHVQARAVEPHPLHAARSTYSARPSSAGGEQKQPRTRLTTIQEDPGAGRLYNKHTSPEAPRLPLSKATEIEIPPLTKRPVTAEASPLQSRMHTLHIEADQQRDCSPEMARMCQGTSSATRFECVEGAGR